MKKIDVRSDTFTLPTDEMIQSIVEAHKNNRFGDDVAGEDEVVNELQDKAAILLGKEKALLVTSGTQGNLISFFAQTRRGDEVVVENHSHAYVYEGGAMASMGGLYPKPVEGVRGYITPETLREAVSPDNPHYAKTSLVVIENTHSFSGGAIVTLEQTRKLSETARELELRIHVDGARLFNSAVAQNITVEKLVKDVDSVQICLSKGLSAPVGSIIAGTEEFIHEAHRIRKKMGGGMRQAGIIAAPGIIALEKMVDRLQEDHQNATLLYERLLQISQLSVVKPDTNIVFVFPENLGISANEFSVLLKDRGVLVYGAYGTKTRLVLNRMVSRDDTLYVADAIEEIVKNVTS
ncbi:MAG: aminotransferase class I/II-fold pyridoxal phosphate-dependent enzyme [Candidatus Thorarchaeota archaeon]|nr:aminotransferase class I/II-fold pyridoxal phosphate-dependent enzyme [Candidatus Thorarchaeota archaeon]